MSSARGRAQKWTLLLIGVLTAVVYLQLIPVAQLNWDDDSNIFKNPYYAINQWRPFWTEPYFGLYVPVTSMVWQALYLLGGGKAFPYRVLNLTLHLANVGLVFLLLKSLARRWSLRSDWPLVAAVALFALHPMQVHTVAWISGGRDLLAAFFALLCVYLFFRLDSPWVLIPTTVLFAAGVLSKPNVVVLPALVPFLCWMVDPPRLRRGLFAAVIWTGVSAVSVYMTLHAQKDFLLELNPWERLLVMGDTYSFYLQKLIFPYPLSANYDRQPEVILRGWEPLWRTIAIVFALIGFVGWARGRDTRMAILLAWFALLLPVSGLVAFGYQRISTPADHYHYLPMAALAAATMLGIDMVPFSEKRAAWIAVVLVPVFWALSLHRVQVWKSDDVFFGDMIRYAPESYSTGLGMSVVRCEQQRNFADGVRWAEQALRERPLDMMALANLAYCHFNSRDYKKTVELEAYLDVLNLEEMEKKQPSALSSFLASIGSAMVENGELYKGYQLLCHSYRIKPSEINHFRNIRTATEILRKAGLNPVCEGRLNYPRQK